MKYSICFFLLTLTCSCEVNQHDQQGSEIEKISKRTDSTFDFESKMQWASYLAAIALDSNEDARAEFSTLITTQNKTISIKDIFLDDGLSIAPAFRDQFNINVTLYSSIICEGGKPELGIVPPSAFENSECTKYFLNFIIKNNCLEFYCPKKFDFVQVLPITSTAHPLSDADNNYGFLRYEKTPGITIIMEKNINPIYVSKVENKNIIVTRPIHGFTCDYSDLGVANFTLFLNN